VGKFVSVQNTIARLPSASNLAARFAGTPFGDVDYIAKMQGLFGNSLIGYYPGAEAPASPLPPALDYSPLGNNGAYTGVTLGQPGIGDGLTCPLYDGVGDFNNIYSAGFAAAFNPAEGTVFGWHKVFDAAVWTDAAFRRLWTIRADATNTIDCYKTNVNNQLFFGRQAGGISDGVATTVAGGITGFFSSALTWSIAAGQLKVYINGAQVGATQTTLGAWVGALGAASTLIGCLSTAGGQAWNGYHAHMGVLNRAATPAEVTAAVI